jgi:hypothetical protein
MKQWEKAKLGHGRELGWPMVVRDRGDDGDGAW